MSTLETAIMIAVAAHAGAQDKGGNPYMLHPLRVMMGVTGEAAQIAGVLHDVVEDTPITLNDLRSMGLPEAAVDAVDCLTKRDGEAYDDYLCRVERNPVARAVKLADLEDNIRLDRLSEVTERDLKRMKRYEGAKARLLAVVGGQKDWKIATIFRLHPGQAVGPHRVHKSVSTPWSNRCRRRRRRRQFPQM